jgi:hypothetical protein
VRGEGGNRWRWDDLPEAVHDAVTALLGAAAFQRVQGEALLDWLRARLHP